MRYHPLTLANIEALCADAPNLSEQQDAAGVNQRYDTIQTAIGLLASNPEAVPWPEIAMAAQQLLQGSPKDWQVAVYLAVAELQINGLAGATQGAHLLTELITHCWAQMTPPLKRIRGRMNAVNWWLEQLNSWLAMQGADGQWDSQAVASLCEQVEIFERTLADQYDDAPIMRSAINRIKQLPQKSDPVETVTPPEEPTAAVADNLATSAPSAAHADSQPTDAPVADATAPTTTTAEPVTAAATTADGGDALFDKTLKLMSDTAARLFADSRQWPLSYRLRRLVAWAPITQQPTADAQGRTQVPPPDSADQDSITDLWQHKHYDDLLTAVEAHIQQYPLWLDLHYYSASALAQQGEAFQPAHTAVIDALAVYIKRLPDLPALRFADGMPLANADTAAWLTDQVTIRAASPQTSAADHEANRADSAVEAAPTEPVHADEALDQAVADCLAQGNIDQALQQLTAALRRGSGQARYKRQVLLAQVLLEAGDTQLADAHARDLLDTIQQCQLDQWDPAVALQGYQVAYEIAARQQREEAAEAILLRINRLDAALARTLHRAHQ